MTRPDPVPVLIDCDPGIDDACALADLFARRTGGEITLEGIIVTAGNMDRATELRNTHAWRELAAQIDPSTQHVPIYAGAATQRCHPHPTTPETHGPGGAGWASFAAQPAESPAPAAPAAPSSSADANADADAGVRAWCDAAERYGGTLQAIVVGPLTTLALALDEQPDLLQRLGGLTIMGGSFCGHPGNTTSVAEWNIHTDPEAAGRVLAACGESSVIPLICGQNLTDHAQITPQQVERLRTEDPRTITTELAAALRFYIDFHVRMREGEHAKIHDLATVGIALDRARVRSVRAQVGVACTDELTRGMTVAEFRPERWEVGADGTAHGLADIALELRGAHPSDLIEEWITRHLAWT